MLQKWEAKSRIAGSERKEVATTGMEGGGLERERTKSKIQRRY